MRSPTRRLVRSSKTVGGMDFEPDVVEAFLNVQEKFIDIRRENTEEEALATVGRDNRGPIPDRA